MYVKSLLRLEGVTVFAVATFAFFTLDGPLWMYLLLALAPDLSMVGYLASPGVGAGTYNAAHTYAVPLALGVVAFVLDASLGLLVAAVWVAHIGADRALTYGLKYPTEFGATHFERV